MCVIVYKPSGKAVVKKKTLRECWRRNSDGAGFAYITDEKDEHGNSIWYYQKGFMSWKKFWNAYNKHQFGKNDTVVCHFRIKSAGQTDPGNTHPFPVSHEYADMRVLEGKTTNIVFHNGTCGTGEDFEMEVDGKKDKIKASDTMVFVKKFVASLSPYCTDSRVDDVMTYLFCDTRDRWLWCKGDDVWMYGDFKEENGIQYSNLLWKSFTHHNSNKHTAHNNNAYGWENDWRYQDSRGGVYGTGNHVFTDKKEVMRTGIVDIDGNVIWDDESEEWRDAIILCPNCLEDKYIDESPFEGVGDSLCLKCGAVFNDDDGKIWMYDEDIKAGKQQNENKG